MRGVESGAEVLNAQRKSGGGSLERDGDLRRAGVPANVMQAFLQDTEEPQGAGATNVQGSVGFQMNRNAGHLGKVPAFKLDGRP